MSDDRSCRPPNLSRCAAHFAAVPDCPYCQANKHAYGSVIDQTHRVLVNSDKREAWNVAEEIVLLVEDRLLREAMDYFMARDGLGYVVEMLARRREMGKWSDG